MVQTFVIANVAEAAVTRAMEAVQAEILSATRVLEQVGMPVEVVLDPRAIIKAALAKAAEVTAGLLDKLQICAALRALAGAV